MSKIAFLISFLLLVHSGQVIAKAAERVLIARGNENYPPMEYMEGGKLTGFHIELVSRVFKDIAITAEFVSLPWKRAIRWVSDGNADAVTYVAITPERERTIIFRPGNIISVTRISFIKHRDSEQGVNFNGNLNTVRHKHIVIPLGFSYGEPFDSFLFAGKDEVSGIENIIKMISRSKDILVVMNADELFFSYKEHPTLQNLEVVKPEILRTNNYLGFSKAREREVLSFKFEKALKAYKQTRDFSDLLKKYQVSSF